MELKTCPFCGSKAERKTNRKTRLGGYSAVVGCKNKKCPAQIEQATIYGTVEIAYQYAEEVWNKRVPIANEEV
jgi:hypothetical protein